MRGKTKKEILATIDYNAQQEITLLTKREYFAALFMQSMVAGEGARMVAARDKRYDETNWKEVVAMNATEFADALLKQLSND